uniref:Uncharacterized protein n=1 Tax=Arundo donax TaxID=35708 RepID=A0A0A9HDC2_ARUDO
MYIVFQKKISMHIFWTY